MNNNSRSSNHQFDNSPEFRLVSAYQSDVVWNGVTTTDDGRVFVCFPRLEGDSGMRIGEIRSDGTAIPYPDLSWNSWQPGQPTSSAFVRTNSLRIGPDNNLWVVDTGTPRMGAQTIDNGAKLVVIDTQTNQVIRLIPLASVLKTNSFVDDVRITSSHIYLTDAGAPALIVLDRETGVGRRILEGDDSVTDMRPILAEGQIMTQQNGEEVRIHADQLEVSPDGKYLYFQPASGLMSRIETTYVNDPSVSLVELAKHVQLFMDTPSTGGTAIDANGNIYLSDINQSRILKITPDGKASTLIADPRLIWVDAMWIDHAGFLWLPAGQLNRVAIFQDGKSTIDFPVHIYKLQIGAKPVRT